MTKLTREQRESRAVTLAFTSTWDDATIDAFYDRVSSFSDQALQDWTEILEENQNSYS